MPKVSNDDVVNFVIMRDKKTRETLTLLKKQLKHFDVERERMNREFNERQQMHLNFIEDDKRFHEERLQLHEKKKEGLVLIVLNLEGEIAEDVEVAEDGAVQIVQLPAPEPRRPRRKLGLVERLTGSKA